MDTLLLKTQVQYPAFGFCHHLCPAAQVEQGVFVRFWPEDFFIHGMYISRAYGGAGGFAGEGGEVVKIAYPGSEFHQLFTIKAVFQPSAAKNQVNIFSGKAMAVNIMHHRTEGRYAGTGTNQE